MRTGNQLKFRERAADKLKAGFGTWSALGIIGMFICCYMLSQKMLGHAAWDPYPYILLNLMLSCLAAVQGIILQISANRGDRINAEVALHTQKNTDDLMTINNQQLEILRELRALRSAVEGRNE